MLTAMEKRPAVLQPGVSSKESIKKPGPPGTGISLIIPVFNGASFIQGNIRQAAVYLGLLQGNHEIIVVDDGSTDQTRALVESLGTSLHGVALRLIVNEWNQGKGFSVRRGVREAGGAYLIFNDADFTYPVGEVGLLASYLERGCDVVIGSRIHPDSQYVIRPGFIPYIYTRHTLSRLFNGMMNLLLGLGIRDTQAGIKGFRKEAAQKIFRFQALNRFSFDLEVLFIAKRLGFTITEMPVRFLYQKEPSTVKYFRDSMALLRDLLRIRWRGLAGRYDRFE